MIEKGELNIGGRRGFYSELALFKLVCVKYDLSMPLSSLLSGIPIGCYNSKGVITRPLINHLSNITTRGRE